MPASAPLPASLQRVAKRVAEGMSDDQIAHEIGLTTKTIRTYVERIYRSLGVHSRAALVLALRKAHTR
jgi:DNA-binding NarL/FixJ family response regulator